jgi:hypothetical protein
VLAFDRVVPKHLAIPKLKSIRRSQMADDSQKQEYLVPFPEGHEKRPFTLIWVESTAVDRLRAGTMAFSETTGGLKAEELGEPESAETTGANPEAADTTITF